MSHWRSERLKRVADIKVSNVDKKSVQDDVTVRLCNYTDVYHNDLITDDLPFMDATATREQVRHFTLRDGDVLITKDSEDPDDIAVPAYVSATLDGVLCGYHLARLRPRRSHIHPKYLFWWFSSASAKEHFSASATGITRFGLRREAIADVPVHLPSLAEQVAIADLLDAETARIDNMIGKKKRLLELITERHQAALDSLVGKEADWLPLKHAVRFQEGPGIMAEDFREDGIPLLRVSCLKGRSVTLDGCNFLDGDLVQRRWSHFQVRVGDYILSASASAGEVAQVLDPSVAGAVPYTGLIRFWSERSDVSAALVAVFLRSSLFDDEIALMKTGVAIQHFGPTHLDRIRMPLPGILKQEAIVQQVDRMDRVLEAVTQRVHLQVHRLQEHRQALITAAVTGQLEIPGAA